MLNRTTLRSPSGLEVRSCAGLRKKVKVRLMRDPQELRVKRFIPLRARRRKGEAVHPSI